MYALDKEHVLIIYAGWKLHSILGISFVVVSEIGKIVIEFEILVFCH